MPAYHCMIIPVAQNVTFPEENDLILTLFHFNIFFQLKSLEFQPKAFLNGDGSKDNGFPECFARIVSFLLG